MSSVIVKSWPGLIPERRYRARRDVTRHVPTSFAKDARHQITVESLLRDRYRTAFEPGCQTGSLTARLATRCDRVIAIDPSPIAVATARRRCHAFQNVEISEGSLCSVGTADSLSGMPDDLGAEEFDLILFNEVGRQHSASQLRELARRLAGRLGQNGEFVAVHGLGASEGQRLTADQIHAVLGDELPLLSVKRVRYPTFRLDIWVRA
jgi:SAM-dependent methyltransferase